MKTGNSRKIAVPLTIAVGAALLAVVVAFTSSGGDNEALDDGLEAAGSEQTPRGIEDDPRAAGAVDAPVVMVIYSDFQCQFCGRYARDTEPELMAGPVKDGTLRIEWRDLPYLGEESATAARAGHAAARQGKFWELEQRLFATQASTNTGVLTHEYLEGLASELGLDIAKFEADMASAEVAIAIQRDIDSATRSGINGTPTFFINGQMIVGAQPLEAFIQAIEKASEAS